jgi:hypothetical protein
MATETNGIFEMTAAAIVAHPHLFEARPFKNPKTGKEEGEPKFSVNLILDPEHPDLKAMKALVRDIALANRPGVDFKTLDLPFKSGTEAADKRAAACEMKNKPSDGEYQRGKAIVVARSKYQPQLAIIEAGKGIINLDTPALLAMHKAKFYFGVEALAQLNFVWHNEVGRNPAGVNAYVNAVVSLGTGKRLSGARPPSEVFKGYVGHTTTENPLDDEIPF